jgi:hypothetical protein
MPAIYEFDFLVRDGGLMSYGSNLPEIGRRVGDLVVRILRGAWAADLPLEQHFEFVVNLTGAPPLSRADEGIPSNAFSERPVRFLICLFSPRTLATLGPGGRTASASSDGIAVEGVRHSLQFEPILFLSTDGVILGMLTKPALRGYELRHI